MNMAQLNPLEITPERREELRSNYAAFETLAARYRDEAGLRSRIDSGDISDSLSKLKIDLPSGVEAKIVADTSDTVHFVLPPDPNTELSEEMLSVLSGGGKTAGSAGSVGSAGTAGCSSAPSTLSSVGSAGTAGTAT